MILCTSILTLQASSDGRDCLNGDDDNGKHYKGKVAKTISGYDCQWWSEQRPHKHENTDVGDHNFCRNPDEHDEGVWCYTMDKKTRWELCDVPKCDKGARLGTNSPSALSGSNTEGMNDVLRGPLNILLQNGNAIFVNNLQLVSSA